MIETATYGPITQFKMGRDMGGQVLYWVAAYLVDELLIDTGCHHAAEELLIILQNKAVKKIFITHYHEDHIGGAALLQEKLGIPVWAHPRTVPLTHVKPDLYPYQELVWGYPEPFTVKALSYGIIETDHYSFEIVETPGHSDDHVSLVEPKQAWCFSGDLFVSDKIKVLRPEEDIRQIMSSMQRLLDRDHEMTLYTSIGKVETKGRKALSSCLEYLSSLDQEVNRLNREEMLSPEEIVEKIFGGESSLAELTDNQFAAGHLITSLLKR